MAVKVEKLAISRQKMANISFRWRGKQIENSNCRLENQHQLKGASLRSIKKARGGYSAKLSAVPNCPWCQIVLVPNCPGAKLSVVPNCPRCQIVLVPNCPVPNCPRCQIVRGAKLSTVPNCPGAKLSAVPNCPRCQIVRC